jgi:hypothetical protein
MIEVNHFNVVLRKPSFTAGFSFDIDRSSTE